MVSNWMLYFPTNLQCTQLCQTCALNHKPIKISTLNCILCDEKDSLQKTPELRGVWPCNCVCVRYASMFSVGIGIILVIHKAWKLH
jgi:hypothetical protein